MHHKPCGAVNRTHVFLTTQKRPVISAANSMLEKLKKILVQLNGECDIMLFDTLTVRPNTEYFYRTEKIRALVFKHRLILTSYAKKNIDDLGVVLC